MSSQKVYIDHLLQFSREQFDPVPKWISDNFTVIDGGVHTGGWSRNKLIVFEDGTYLELKRTWRRRDRSDCLKPQEGGRKNAEGVGVRWKIVKAGYTQGKSTPRDEFSPRGRTDAPFFCHDLTPRRRRVTFDLPSVTQHPSGVTGIDRIEVLVPRNKFCAYTDLYTSIVGASPQEDEGRAEFKLSAPGILSLSGSPYIRPAETEADEQFLRENGVGISSLLLRSEIGESFSFPIAEYLQ
ncbi:hypothetical protein BDW60DRAFT_203042 [Aspergillus nidulans var. acristatus]